MSDYHDAKQNYTNDKASKLGVQAAYTWKQDPKRLGFVLSRYKFVAKMLNGKSQVLEVGSGDAWASRVVRQHVTSLDCIDIDRDFVRIGNENQDTKWKIYLSHHDMLMPLKNNSYDAAFALDVFEHIEPQNSDNFLKNMCNTVKDSGVIIIGVPTLETQKFSNPNNGHINCMTGAELRDRLERYFYNVFCFSMNDEVVHTGMFQMANYLFFVCCTKRSMG